MNVISDVKILDKDCISDTNVKGKFIDKGAFDWMLGESRIITANYGKIDFHNILGLAFNIRKKIGSIICDLHIYDVNGFDTELFSFVDEGLKKNAFRIRPLISILHDELVGNTIMKADIVNCGVVL